MARPVQKLRCYWRLSWVELRGARCWRQLLAIAPEGAAGNRELAACGESGDYALGRCWPQRVFVFVPVKWATHCEAASVVCNSCRRTRRHSWYLGNWRWLCVGTLEGRGGGRSVQRKRTRTKRGTDSIFAWCGAFPGAASVPWVTSSESPEAGAIAAGQMKRLFPPCHIPLRFVPFVPTDCKFPQHHFQSNGSRCQHASSAMQAIVPSRGASGTSPESSLRLKRIRVLQGFMNSL